MVFGFLLSQPPLATVSGNELSAAAEMIDGQTAVVGTSPAFGHSCGIFQRFNLVNGEHGCAFAVHIPLSCDQSGSESAHDTGDVRTDNLAVSDLFQASQHGVIVKGSALYHDMLSKFRRVGNLDDLKECIFDDRISKTCGNIRNRSAFFLGLFYLGIHKYCAPGPQVDGMGGKERLMCKVFYRIIQRFGKGLDKRSAAGRAGLVQLYAVYGLVLDLDTFHVLAADVQDAVYIRFKERSGIVVSHCLYLALIQEKRGFDQRLAVSGGAGMYDLYLFRKLAVNIFDGADGSAQRVAFVVIVEGI